MGLKKLRVREELLCLLRRSVRRDRTMTVATILAAIDYTDMITTRGIAGHIDYTSMENEAIAIQRAYLAAGSSCEMRYSL